MYCSYKRLPAVKAVSYNQEEKIYGHKEAMENLSYNLFGGFCWSCYNAQDEIFG
jgi:hypothetical protein